VACGDVGARRGGGYRLPARALARIPGNWDTCEDTRATGALARYQATETLAKIPGRVQCCWKFSHSSNLETATSSTSLVDADSVAGEDTRANGTLTPLRREDTRAAWGTCRRMLVGGVARIVMAASGLG
jgi:hypothetical protein